MSRSRFWKLIVLALVLAVCLAVALPAFAQDDGVIVVPNGTEFGETWGPVLIVGLGLGFIALVLLLIIGLYMLLGRAQSELGVSVPKDSFQSFTDGLLQTVQSFRDEMKQLVERTTNPYDNILYNLGDIPLGMLIEEAKKRGLMVLQPDPTGTLAVDPGDPLLREPEHDLEATRAFGNWRKVPPQEVREAGPTEAPK